jgi:hypothetical protein
MHNENIEPIYNLYDPEKPEAFIYDVELLNAWFWSEFVLEWNEDEN